MYLQAGTRMRTRSRTSSGICEKIFLGHSVENFDVVCTSYGKFSGVWHWLKTTIVTIYIYMIFWQSNVVIGPLDIPELSKEDFWMVESENPRSIPGGFSSLSHVC